ncbi:MAG: hypothetical protein KY469_14360 [Actinobacteria bacterium]|nr:hypothetical protein [Actinomycetota bacterium]
MRTVQLREIAFVRSGDKGNTSNVGVVPYEPQHLDLLKEQLTVDRVREHFGPLVRGDVTRYEFSGISALNFVLTEALGGGVSRSLALDTHGKAYASLMLAFEVEVPDDITLRLDQ